MESMTFHIPFNVLRGLLPPDGQRILVWNGRMNQWRQNRSPFERHETAEIAFGRAIRAQKKHRDNERSMSPGITCGNGSIQLRGGWAAHKAVDHHNDYFDGEFNANVTLAMNNGQISSSVSLPRLTWNESFVGKLGNLLGDIANKMVEKIRTQLESGLQQKLESMITEKIDEVLRQVPQAEVARQHVSMALLPDTVVLTVSYKKPRLVVSRNAVETAKQVVTGTVLQTAAAKKLGRVSAAKRVSSAKAKSAGVVAKTLAGTSSSAIRPRKMT